MTINNDSFVNAGIPKINRRNVVAACLAVLTREVCGASIEKKAAFDLLRDAPDKIESALTRGQNALVVYRLDPQGARGIVSDNERRLRSFTDTADRDGAPLFGFCPGTIAEIATCIQAGAASLKKDS